MAKVLGGFVAVAAFVFLGPERALAVECEGPSLVELGPIGDATALDLADPSANLTLSFRSGESSWDSVNALLPEPSSECGTSINARVGQERAGAGFGGTVDLDAREDAFGEGLDRSGHRFGNALARLGGGDGPLAWSFEAAYVDEPSEDAALPQHHFGAANLWEMLDGRIRATTALALSQDDSTGESGTAELYRIDGVLWRGDAFSLDGYAAYEKTTPDYLDDDTETEADRITRTFGSAAELGPLGFNLAYSVSTDNTARDRQEMTHRWRAWRSGVDVDLGEVFDTGPSAGVVPDRLFIDLDHERVGVIDLGEADPEDATRERETGLGFKLKWLDRQGNTTLKVSTTKFTDELSKELTRKVQIIRSIEEDIWKLSFKAGLSQTMTREGTTRTSEYGYAFAIDLDLWPGRYQTLGLQATADLVGAGNVYLDDVSTLLTYRLRF